MIRPVDIETTSCPLCGSASHAVVADMRDRLCHVAGRFALVRCTACELLYLNPRPTEAAIGRYYPPDYDPFARRALAEMSPFQRYTVRYGLRKRCRLVLDHQLAGRLLDIGCATGLFLAEMRQYPGWQVYGVEPSAEAAAFARGMLGLEVHVGDVASASYPDGYFDVVTMWDVLEHLHDPQTVLREIHRILRPDGFLILRTPSLDSWDAQVFGAYWAGLDAPRHLVIFARRTMAQLLTHTGFRCRRLVTGGGSYFITLLSLRFWLEEKVASPRLRWATLALVDNFPTRLVTALPFAILDRLGLGSGMVVIAQPQEGMPVQKGRKQR